MFPQAALHAARLPTIRPDIARPDFTPIAINTGSYCKARQRLPEVLITTLGRLVADRVEADAKPWNWNGHPVQIVDGSTVSMPDTQANQEAFPQPKNQKPGVGFPLARLLLIVSLATGCVRRMRVAVDRPGFRPKVLHLVTTLLDAQRYPKADVATLYRRRWQIELHLRALKADGEMGILRCQSPSMVRKEIALHVLVFNAVRAVMVTAGIGVNREPWWLS